METESKPHNYLFYIHATVVFLFPALCYSLVFFHRSAPAVLSKQMAPDFHVPVADLTIFSSMFFWIYSLMQPFGGLLADVMDPAFLITAAASIASTGSIICGISKSLTLAVFGRFIVGFGCAPTYVPFTKLLTRWYPTSLYAIFGGLALSAGGCGGIIAQAPLANFASIYGWRTAFIDIGILGFFFALLVLLFVRLDPTNYNYLPVNPEASKAVLKNSFNEKMIQLWINFKRVVSNPVYILFSLFAFTINGSYYNVLGLWGGPYIREIFPHFGDGKMLVSLSISMIFGSLILPVISNLVKSRKWVLFGSALIAFLCSLTFFLYDLKMSFTSMFITFLIWGSCTGSTLSVLFPMIIEAYDTTVASTAIGCVNIFAFIGGAVSQTISGFIIGSYDLINGIYPHSAYKYGLWTPVCIYLIIAMIVTQFLKDNMKNDVDKNEKSNDNEEIANNNLKEI